MDENEGFVKNSKVAFKGILNGLFGSMLYEYVLLFFVSFAITIAVSGKNPTASREQLEVLVNNAYGAFPYGILISCLANLITLIVFVLIIKPKEFINLCKKVLDFKILKYGAIASLCLLGFSLVYNNLAMIIFDLESAGNANQEAVTDMIKSNVILSFMVIVLLGPVVEELTFRYCMFGEISKKNKVLAYIVSGTIFMFIHSIASIAEAGGLNVAFAKELIYLPPYLFSGLALCYVYDKTKNIGSSAVAHILNNLVSFLLVVLL